MRCKDRLGLSRSIDMRASDVDSCVGSTKEGMESQEGNPASVALEGEVGASSVSTEVSKSGNTAS